MILTSRGSPGPWSLGSNDAKNEPFRSKGLKKVVLVSAFWVVGKALTTSEKSAARNVSKRYAAMLP